MKGKVHPFVTNPLLLFRCPVCGRIQPRYESIVICCVGKDRTICIECANLITQAMEQLHKDDKGDGHET